MRKFPRSAVSNPLLSFHQIEKPSFHAWHKGLKPRFLQKTLPQRKGYRLPHSRFPQQVVLLTHWGTERAASQEGGRFLQARFETGCVTPHRGL